MLLINVDYFTKHVKVATIIQSKKRKRGLKESMSMLRGDTILGNDNARDLLRIFEANNLHLLLSSEDEDEKSQERNVNDFIAILTDKAENGDGEAQFALGYMYRKGVLVEEDEEISCKWLLKASESGNANGQCSMGVMYYWGKGVAKDHIKVKYFYLFCYLLSFISFVYYYLCL